MNIQVLHQKIKNIIDATTIQILKKCMFRLKSDSKI